MKTQDELNSLSKIILDACITVHEAQIISHLKLSDKRLGFLVNFNVPLLKDGFRKFVNNF